MSLGRKIFTSSQIRNIDQYTIKSEPIASIDLMERAAKIMTEWLYKNFPVSTRFIIFAGPGNNGGDAIAMSRILFYNNYFSKLFIVTNNEANLSPDGKINLQRVKKETIVEVKFIDSIADFPKLSSEEIIIDGLFGSGLSRPLDGIFADLVNHINRSNAKKIAIDIPSGLFDYDNTNNNLRNIVQATYTLSLQVPKVSFFLKENEKDIGKWIVLPIGLHPIAIENEQTTYYYVTRLDVQKIFKKRLKFSHKGNYGHALLIGGSKGKIGAIVLGAKACLRTGVGLLSTYIPGCGYHILQTTVPESMVLVDNTEEMITLLPDISNYNVIGIGPGLGQNKQTAKQLKKLLKKINVPLVLDADAINLIAQNRYFLKLIPKNTIFTPHPKEFERLCNKKFKNSLERLKFQQQFSKKSKCIIVLKGVYSSTSLPNGNIYFNTTGNPGMATAGSGDVLTGIILSLLAQNYTPEKAAILGTYLHGLAGDIAAKEYTQQGLIAGDIISMLPMAWKKLQ